MNLTVEPYLVQVAHWPARGKHILANFDEDSVVVYQAYSPAIADFVVREGYFGAPEFSYSRMSWIKTNFLWMMYRSGWGTKEGQERTLPFASLETISTPCWWKRYPRHILRNGTSPAKHGNGT